MAETITGGGAMPAGRRPHVLISLVVAISLIGSCGAPQPAPTAPTGTQGPTGAPAGEGTLIGVEVTPQAVLLTAAGESEALTAVGRDGVGSELAIGTSWASSDPSVVSVDAQGKVRAIAAIGTALVTASVGDIKSAPVYVTVAQPVAGAVLIGDAQIVSGPSFVDPAGEADPQNPYEVVLRGVDDLADGMVLINTGGLPVAGRVVATEATESDTRVRLVVVPPTELFTDFSFSDSVALSDGPFEVAPDLADAYDVVQVGAEFDFTPKSAGRSPSVVFARASGNQQAPPVWPAQAQGTQALPPLPPFKECEASLEFGSGLPMPLALSAAPAFSFTASGSAQRVATPAGTKFILTGTPTFKFGVVLEVRSGFEAKVGCKLTLIKRKFRVPGWAGLFFGGDVEFGIGFEVGGKVTLFSAKVGGTVEIKPVLSATLDCPAAGDCGLTGDVTATTDVKPTLTAPSLNQAQFEPSISLFGFVSLEAGNADIERLQFEAIEIKAGAELGASLAPEVLQIDNTDSESGRSKYSLALKGEVGPGIKLGEFLTYVGLSKVIPIKLSVEIPLGESPTGTVKADHDRYLPGDQATVDVSLAQGSSVFPNGGLYNVDRVFVLRKDGFLTQVLAEQAASNDQTDFSLSFQSPGLINANELFAFVVTRLLPLDPPKLEIGPAAVSAATITVQMSGSTDVVPAALAAAEQLMAQNPSFRYNVTGPGTSGGFQQFCTGLVDVVLAARPISDDETQLCASNGIHATGFALGYYNTDRAATNPALAALVAHFGS